MGESRLIYSFALHFQVLYLSSTLREFADRCSSARKTEIDVLGAQTQGGADLDEFYKRLKRIQEYHARYPNQVVNAFEVELGNMMDEFEEMENEEFEQEDRRLPFGVNFSALVNVSGTVKLIGW